MIPAYSLKSNVASFNPFANGISYLLIAAKISTCIKYIMRPGTVSLMLTSAYYFLYILAVTYLLLYSNINHSLSASLGIVYNLSKFLLNDILIGRGRSLDFCLRSASAEHAGNNSLRFGRELSRAGYEIGVTTFREIPANSFSKRSGLIQAASPTVKGAYG